jgi:hypothetical protein
MPDYSRNTVFILTPLIFRYHLPLRGGERKEEIEGRGRVVNDNKKLEVARRGGGGRTKRNGGPRGLEGVGTSIVQNFKKIN